MKATTNRQALLETVGKAKLAAITGQYASLPILKHVLIMAGKGRIAVVGNNMDYLIIESCEAQVTRSGQVAIPPKPLEDFLKAIKDKTVTLTLSGKRDLKITADGTTATLEGMEAKDYPTVPRQKGKVVIVSDLGKALDEVLYAVDKKGNRPVLAGVSFTPRNGRVELAAADGFRLAITSAKVRGNWPETVIIPGEALQIAKRLFQGDVAVSAQGKNGNKNVSFQQGTLILFTHPIEGTFPNYQQLVPKGGRVVKFATKAVQEALRKVRVIQPTTSKVTLRSKGNKMTIAGEQPGVGQVAVTVAVKGKIKSAIDLNYLSELLSHLDDETTMRLQATEDAPIMVRRNGTIHVVMPMCTQWEDKKPSVTNGETIENQREDNGETVADSGEATG